MIWAIIGFWAFASNVVVFAYDTSLSDSEESLYHKDFKRMSNGELLFYFAFLPASLLVLLLNFTHNIYTKSSIGGKVGSWLNKKPFEKDSK